MTPTTQPPFQPSFVWGVSTSAYQIEGAAREDGRGDSIWDVWCRQPGNVLDASSGDVACDHYHRFNDDIPLMKDLGVDAYRFSISWSRVLPEGRGRLNRAGLAFYDRLLDALDTAGIQPWLCLYHWDLPQALEDAGGWRNRDTAHAFAEYAALMVERYGSRLPHVATFNEATIVTLFGHLLGTNAPGLASLDAYLSAVHHINLAHGLAVERMRAIAPHLQLGCIHTLQPVRAASAADQEAAQMLDACWNGAFADTQHSGQYPSLLQSRLEPWIQPGDMTHIQTPQDWIGVNHYSPVYARADANAPLGFALCDAPAGTEVSGVGWEIDPAAFRDTLVQVSERYGLPVYVTENGYGDANEAAPQHGIVKDTARATYITRYIDALNEARSAGADVRGYFAWSLLDNFEWAFGYQHRFGLVHVDFETQVRTPKLSAMTYLESIRKQRSQCA